MPTTCLDGIPAETFTLPKPAGRVVRLPGRVPVTTDLAVPPASTVVLLAEEEA